MPRPKKCRKVGFIPCNDAFYPHVESVEEVMLSLEEVEALRLADLNSMEQDACAGSMEISRGTFQRIIKVARQKVADAVINGKVIRIDGGIYKISEEHKCHRGCRKFCHNADNEE